MISVEEKTRLQLRNCVSNIADGNWAVYGTGDAAKTVIDEIQNLNLGHNIKYVLERDDSPMIGNECCNYLVTTLKNVYKQIDTIFIAATYHHRTIKERIADFIQNRSDCKIQIIDVCGFNTIEDIKEYEDYIASTILNNRNNDFVEFNDEDFKLEKTDSKIIAYYLPQFHQMDINNKFHGQGFTEWTNTSKAIPMFVGHHQPQIPYDVGYYDLMNIDTFKRQIYLANHYGIYGFCFYYYWFSGKRIMEKPLEIFLNHKELNMPFCLCWANENWSKNWDGGNKDIMLEQHLNDNDDIKFIVDMLPYMKDSRYIRINDKPVLVIYRCNMFSQNRFKKFIHNIRDYAKKEGFSDLYIMLANSFGFDEEATSWNGDALVEYQPHIIWRDYLIDVRPEGYLNSYFQGKIINILEFLQEKKYLVKYDNEKFFRSALTEWDNSARRALENGMIMWGNTPEKYKQWLKDIMLESKQIHSTKEDIVFVNSWNEWAEGSHLEPDTYNGYAYLQSTREALEEIRGMT